MKSEVALSALASRPGEFIDRFLSYTDPEPMTGCWLWTGTMMQKGYGQFTALGIHVLAHRASWVLHHGAIPHGLLVCHKCDTPQCVNPSHFFLGTYRDNNRDARTKGRLRPCAKALTKAKAAEIRAIGRSLPVRVVAARYGVSRSLISNVLLNNIWKIPENFVPRTRATRSDKGKTLAEQEAL